MAHSKIVLASLLLFFVGAARADLAPMPNDPNAKLKTEKSITIVALGDSLTEGYGIEKSKAYPTLVEAKLRAEGKKVTVINAGVSGSTTASAPGRVKWLLKNKPDVIFLALGSNDGLRGVDVATTKKNLKTAIDLAKQNHIQVWLAGALLPPNYGPQQTAAFKKLFSDLAKEENLPFMPFLLEGVATVQDLNQTDMIHPNEKGHAILADQVADFFRKNWP